MRVEHVGSKVLDSTHTLLEQQQQPYYLSPAYSTIETSTCTTAVALIIEPGSVLYHRCSSHKGVEIQITLLRRRLADSYGCYRYSWLRSNHNKSSACCLGGLLGTQTTIEQHYFRAHLTIEV